MKSEFEDEFMDEFVDDKTHLKHQLFKRNDYKLVFSVNGDIICMQLQFNWIINNKKSFSK